MEYLKSLHHDYTHPNDNETCALSKEHAEMLTKPPPGVDRSLWLYELCRFLVQKINAIVTSLFADTPPCSSVTCPEMRASEWQYLCAVHDPPKPCCAIDYCCHTLDWAANILTNPKQFPSRLALNINSDSSPSSPNSTKNALSAAPNAQQVRQLTNICRRVYRIFAHAWFQHRDTFWRVEHETGLYVFFKTVCDVYQLIPADNYTIPAEAEGEEAAAAAAELAARSKAEGSDQVEEDAYLSSGSAAPAPSILRRPAEQAHIVDASAGSNTVVAAGGAARRHRRELSKTTPGVVETVVEEAEEDEDHSESSRPNTLRETDTQIHVPQVNDGASEEAARSSSFPSFDDDADEQPRSRRHPEVDRRDDSPAHSWNVDDIKRTKEMVEGVPWDSKGYKIWRDPATDGKAEGKDEEEEEGEEGDKEDDDLVPDHEGQ
jgi:hypothetical protein